MIGTAIAKRYARALFECSVEDKAIDAYLANLGIIADLFATSPELISILSNEAVSLDKRMAIWNELETKLSLTEHVSNSIRLLIERNRIEHFTAVRFAFQQMVERHLKITKVLVTTATPLSESMQTKLKSAMKKITGCDVVLDITIDPTIHAGLIVRVGDTVFDGSLNGELGRLKEALLTH